MGSDLTAGALDAVVLNAVVLNAVASVEMGRAPSSAHVGSERIGSPFLQGSADFGPLYPRPVQYCSQVEKQCQPGDVLISVRAPVGALNKADQAYVIGRGLAAVRFTGVSAEFGWHLLSYWAKDLQRVSRGSTFAAIKKRDLETLRILLPPRAEQQRITALLDAADATIRHTGRLIARLRQVKTGLRHDLITCGLAADGRVRDPDGHPEQFVGTALGRVPRGWVVTTIAGLGASKPHAIADGPFGSHLKSEHYRDHGVPVIQSGFVTTGEFVAGPYVYVDEAHFSSQARSAVEAGDIVIAKVGAQSGTCAIMPEGHPRSILAGNCLKISPDPARCRARYLLQVLQDDYDTGKMALARTETAQPAISLKNLRALTVALPDVDEQERIVAVLDAHDARIRAEEAALVKLRQLKLGLMEDLLNH
jgi:type I restriction enzyme S subunit